MKEKIRNYLDEIKIIEDSLKSSLNGFQKKMEYERKKANLRSKWGKNKQSQQHKADKFNFILKIPDFEEKLSDLKSLKNKKRSSTLFRPNKHYKIVLDRSEASSDKYPPKIAFEDAFDILSQIKEKYSRMLDNIEQQEIKPLSEQWDNILNPYHRKHWESIFRKNKNRKEEKKKQKKQRNMLTSYSEAYKTESSVPTSTSLLELTHLQVKLNNLDYERQNCSGLRKIEIANEKDEVLNKINEMKKEIKKQKHAFRV